MVQWIEELCITLIAAQIWWVYKYFGTCSLIYNTLESKKELDYL